MATPMNSKEWPRFVLPIIRKEWTQKMNEIQSPLAPYFGIETSLSSVEYSQGIGSFDLVPEYNSATAEGQPQAIEYDSFNPLYETTFTHKEYAKGVAIERKLWDDDRSGQIRRRAQSLGYAFGTTIATHMSSVLNNAFSSSYVGGDAVSLCNTSHPVNSVSSSTFSNKGTTALSYDAVVATLIAGQDLNDDRGNPLPVIYDTLYVPTALQATAYEIVNALAKPGTADNDANFLKAQGLQVVVDPYLSDANNWFMLNKTMSKMHLLWFWRVRPEIALDPSSSYDLVAKYRGYTRYSYGWDDARWVYGMEVA
jgi:hypothetical protein